MGLIFNPRWEWRDPAIRGGIPLIPPGIPGGISGIPPGPRLTFYLGRSMNCVRIIDNDKVKLFYTDPKPCKN